MDVLNQPGQKQGERFQFALKGGVQRDGCPVVKFKELEWRKLDEKDEELLLVGRFTQSRPPIDDIRSAFQRLIPVVVRRMLEQLMQEQSCCGLL